MPRWTRRNQSLHVAETKLGLTAWRNASRRRKNETFCRVCCQSSNHFNQSDTGLDKEDRLQRSKTGFNQINVTTLFAVRKKEKIGLSWLHWPLAFHFTSSRLFELFLRFLLRLPLFAQKTQNLTLGASANRKSCLFSVCMSCHHSAEGLIFNMFLEPGVTGLLLQLLESSYLGTIQQNQMAINQKSLYSRSSEATHYSAALLFSNIKTMSST